MKKHKLLIMSTLLNQGAFAADDGKSEMRALIALQQAQIAALQGQLNAPRLIGTSDLPVDFNDVVGSDWKRLQLGWGQAQTPIYEDFLEPGRRPEARICLLWSDDCSEGAFSIKLAPGASTGDVSPHDTRPPVYFADGFHRTWSGGQLFHSRCGPWVSAPSILDHCGGGWGGTCQLMIKREGPACRTIIKKGHIEWRSVAR